MIRLMMLGMLLWFTQNVWAFSCDDFRPILQKPIIFNKERIVMTREYQKEHYGIDSQSIKIDPKMIVIHWTALPTMEEAFEFMNSPKLEKRDDLPGKLNVSAQFLVDKDGTIYQLMPDHWMARHVIGLNHYAIGIENVGGVDGHEDLTDEQAESDAYLVCHLKKKYAGITYLIGHFEYLNFKGGPLWMEKDGEYVTVKHDPGKKFLEKVKLLSHS